MRINFFFDFFWVILQITAETAYDMVSPGPSVRRIRGNRKGKRKRINPPQDIREGVTNAFHIVREVSFEICRIRHRFLYETNFRVSVILLIQFVK